MSNYTYTFRTNENIEGLSRETKSQERYRKKKTGGNFRTEKSIMEIKIQWMGLTAEWKGQRVDSIFCSCL